MNWRELALCAQVDGDVWFPENGGTAEPARRICQRCPVQAECLAYALPHPEWPGVWGGLSRLERRQLSAAEPGQVAA